MQQSALNFGQPSSSTPKRPASTLEDGLILHFGQGNSVDLSQPIQLATPEIVEALRRRVLALQAELASSKRTKTTAAPATTSAKPVSVAAERKLRIAHVKSVFAKLARECKSTNHKWHNAPPEPQSIKIEEVLTKEEFDKIFGDAGTLLQPTPQNKPKSTVIIRELTGVQAVELVEGVKTAELKGSLWRPGRGIPFPRKAERIGICSLCVQSLNLEYSTNGQKLTLRFMVYPISGDDDMRW